MDLMLRRVSSPVHSTSLIGLSAPVMRLRSSEPGKTAISLPLVQDPAGLYSSLPIVCHTQMPEQCEANYVAACVIHILPLDSTAQ